MYVYNNKCIRNIFIVPFSLNVLPVSMKRIGLLWQNGTVLHTSVNYFLLPAISPLLEACQCSQGGSFKAERR